MTYTKAGFNRSGFSCCDQFKKCEMGRKTCYLAAADIDQEAKDSCHCYLRHHKQTKSKMTKLVEQIELLDYEEFNQLTQ